MENSESIVINEMEYDNLAQLSKSGPVLLDLNIDLISNVKVKLDVYVGTSQITVSDLFELNENSIITLDRDISSPILVKLDGNVIAYGVLVAVGDKFGIKITHINNSKE